MGDQMSAVFYRICHPIKAYCYWRAIKRAEKLFGKFGPKPF